MWLPPCPSGFMFPIFRLSSCSLGEELCCRRASGASESPHTVGRNLTARSLNTHVHADEELRCVRLAVPLLSKACGMDARASLALAQSSLAAAAARGLVREAQRPLSVLNTFGAMLTPRLADGEPDKDMAKGIVVQVRPCETLSLVKLRSS